MGKNNKSSDTASKKKINQLEKELKLKDDEINQKNEKLLRVLADFDNYRKRFHKDLEDKINCEKERIYLLFLDLFETLKTATKDINNDGITLLINQFSKLFIEEGIEEIEAVDKTFNYDLHHVVATKECNKAEGIIIEELKKGYKMRDKVIRPSYVIVAKGEKNGKTNRN